MGGNAGREDRYTSLLPAMYERPDEIVSNKSRMGSCDESKCEGAVLLYVTLPHHRLQVLILLRNGLVTSAYVNIRPN